MGDLMYPHHHQAPFPMAHNSMLTAMPVYLPPRVPVLPRGHPGVLPRSIMPHEPAQLMEVPPSVRHMPLPMQMIPVDGMMQQMEMAMPTRLPVMSAASKSLETMNARSGVDDAGSSDGTWPVQGDLGRSPSNAISVEQFETHHDAATATAIATGASNGPNCAEGSLPSAQPASTPLMTTAAAPHLAGASAGMQRWPGAPVGVYSYSSSMMAPQSLVASPANFSGMTVDADSVPGYQQSVPSSSWAEASAYDVTASGRSWSGLALSLPPASVSDPIGIVNRAPA